MKKTAIVWHVFGFIFHNKDIIWFTNELMWLKSYKCKPEKDNRMGLCIPVWGSSSLAHPAIVLEPIGALGLKEREESKIAIEEESMAKGIHRNHELYEWLKVTQRIAFKFRSMKISKYLREQKSLVGLCVRETILVLHRRANTTATTSFCSTFLVSFLPRLDLFKNCFC